MLKKSVCRQIILSTFVLFLLLFSGSASARYSGSGAYTPEWLKRIEFQWGVVGDHTPEFSLFTVQPIKQSYNKKDTYFFQGQMAYAEETINDERLTTNLGVGYRRLFAQDRAMIGVNSFLDHQSEMNHFRASIGGELRFYAFDFFGNYYQPLTGKKGSDDAEEELASGWDFEVMSQVPYLPWVRASLVKYEWETEDGMEKGDDSSGFSYHAEADLTSFLQLAAGMDDAIGEDYYVNLRFRVGSFGEDGKHTALKLYQKTGKVFSSRFFTKRDMKKHLLSRVRRQNFMKKKGSCGMTSYEKDVLAEVNAFRSANGGLAALAYNCVIQGEARGHNNNMANGSVPFSHDGFAGRANRIASALSTTSHGENVAMGYTSAASVVAGWAASPGHRANMLGTFTLTGLAAVKSSGGTWYYTQIFAFK
ncbi:MAG: inverse autotransporter beta domain-containing protein [Alphaproteobacteria bacterium]